MKGVVIRASLEDEVWDIEHSDLKEVVNTTQHFNSAETEAPDDTAERIYDDLAEEDEQSFRESATGYTLAQLMNVHADESDEKADKDQPNKKKKKRSRSSSGSSSGGADDLKGGRRLNRRPAAKNRQPAETPATPLKGKGEGLEVTSPGPTSSPQGSKDNRGRKEKDILAFISQMCGTPLLIAVLTFHLIIAV